LPRIYSLTTAKRSHKRQVCGLSTPHRPRTLYCLQNIFRLATFFVSGCSLGVPCAYGLQYQRVDLKDNKILISARGPIISGYFQRLLEFGKSLPSTDYIIGFSFDSPGGSVLEAIKIVGLIKDLNAAVLVDSGNECSSACFLLFAAGSRRFVGPDALIGVHSVSEAGEETAGSMAFTTEMAREAGDLGVPPAIIGKLVETQPGRVAWLTPADLASMGAEVVGQNPTPPPVAAAPVNPPSSAPENSYSSNTEMQTAPYEQGAADRRAWETWFNQLTGDFHGGAEYWSGQRSLPRPGSCYGPAGQTFGDWTAGCVAAKRLLDPTDIRRRSEPDYRAGWNSY
jgi:hypothetical protein